jgi:hypothetical protein
MKKLILINVILITSIFLLGCTGQIDNFEDNLIYNEQINNKNTVEPEIFDDEKNDYNLPINNTELIDCENDLNCLIDAVQQNKEAKAILESNLHLFENEYINKDYLEIIFEENKFILFRKILNEKGLTGSCEFSKEELTLFLKNWNENSFNSNYYNNFNCKGSLYEISKNDGETNE